MGTKVKKMRRQASKIFKRCAKKIEEISLREFENRYVVKTKTKSGVIDYILKIVRDLSVQREGTWDKIAGKMSNFLAEAIVGNGNNNMLHYVDLEKCRAKAEKSSQYNYMAHLANFLKQGAELCHLDGGNRTDTYFAFLTNKLALQAGYYDFGTDDNGNRIFFNLEEDTLFKDMTEKDRDTVLDYCTLVIVIYEDLNQEERALLFKTLNDGVDLNAAEKRNAEVSDICAGIREMNGSYKNIFIDVGALTQKKADRWLFCEWVAKLMNTSNNYLNTGSWVSAGSKDIDNDYQSGSQADLMFDSSKNFFEKEYLSYIKLIKKIRKVKDLKNAELYYSAAYIDLYMLLTYMKKENIKLYQSNVETKIQFLNDYNDEIVDYFGDEKTDYYIKTTKGVKRYEKYAGITTKSTDVALSARINKLIDNFIVKQLDEKKLVKVTKRETDAIQTKVQKATLFNKQKGKAASTDDVLNTLNLNKETHLDHKKSVRKGGSDTLENKNLETKTYNLEKNAKDIEEVTA